MKNQVRKYLLLALLGWVSLLSYAQSTIIMTTSPSAPCTTSTVGFTVYDINGIVNLTNTNMTWTVSNGLYTTTAGNTLNINFPYPGNFQACAFFINPATALPDTVCGWIFINPICGPNDLVTGTIYFDNNNNGTQDPGENGLPFGTVSVNPGGMTYAADGQGYFSFPLAAGTYTLSCNPLPYCTVSQPIGSSYSVTSTGSQSIQGGNHFGLFPTPNQQDVMVHLVATNMVPGFNGNIFATIYNFGTTPLNGAVSITLDPNVTFNNGSPGGTFNAGVFTWPYNNLAPNRSITTAVNVSVSPSLVIGNTLQYIGDVTPLVGDMAPANNNHTLIVPVVAAVDPNDKQASAAGMGPGGEINAGDELTYTIRFQNEGNFPATFIYIRDTLDPNLDWSSFRVLGASHSMTHTLWGDKIQFYFDDIQLVPKTQDEAASQGFVKYQIRAKNSLAPGDSVRNTASIYFDYNPPVVTNTTLNTVWIVVGAEQGLEPMEFDLFPNPMENQAILRFDAQGESWNLVISDPEGRRVYSRNNERSGEIQINREDLSAGVYLFQLTSESGKGANGKVIVQ